MASNVRGTDDKGNADIPSREDSAEPSEHRQDNVSNTNMDAPSLINQEDHKHVFLLEDQSFDEKNMVVTKRCHCGFSVQVEEL